MDRRPVVHRRLTVLYLGAIHTRAQLERGGHIQRRSRADYLRALCVSASSNLYRTTDHVRGHGGRARTHRRNYRCAARVRELLDKTALRRKTHAPEIPE